MLLGVALGDAVGAGVEMQSRSVIEKVVPKDLGHYVDLRTGNFAINYWRGRYTDDTEHTVAVLKLLCDPNAPFNREQLFQRFFHEYFRVGHVARCVALVWRHAVYLQSALCICWYRHGGVGGWNNPRKPRH